MTLTLNSYNHTVFSPVIEPLAIFHKLNLKFQCQNNKYLPFYIYLQYTHILLLNY